MATSRGEPPDEFAAQILKMLSDLHPGTPVTATTTIRFGQSGDEAKFRDAVEALAHAARQLGVTKFDHMKRLMPAGSEAAAEYLVYERWDSVERYRQFWVSGDYRAFRATVGGLGGTPRLSIYPGPPAGAGERARALMPKTGQTHCWDALGERLPAGDPRGAGQDGQVQAGEAWPTPRFEDNGDGTVTDHLTNLVWLQQADYFGERTWEEALKLAHELHSGCPECPELSDGSTKGQWHVPNIRELLSLVDYGMKNSPILPEGNHFLDTKSGKYWTSTSLTPAPQLGWMMTLGLGPTVFDIKEKHNKTRLWPVRTGVQPSRVPKTGQTTCWDADGNLLPHGQGIGQDGHLQCGMAWPKHRFTDHGDGTVTDHLTGLVWLKNANPFGFLTWQDALDACNALEEGEVDGLNDGSKPGEWRLPNIREIESLVDYSRAAPCLPPGHPFGDSVQPSSYWTSTTLAPAPSEAFFIILGVGPSIFENKGHSFFAWPVRNRRAVP